MNENSIFWNQQHNCAIIYVAGFCNQQNLPNGKASFGICWNFGDSRNITGHVVGVQNQIRAELSGLKKAIEMAVQNKVVKLMISMKSEKLDTELDFWENSLFASQKMMQNSDLLKEIQQWQDEAKDNIYWLTEPLPNQMQGYQMALDMAKLSATAPPPPLYPHLAVQSIPQKPPSKFQKPPKTEYELVKCAISGVCEREGQKNSQASFAAFYGENDPRNVSGRVEDVQTSLRGEVSALKKALEREISAEKPVHLHVITRSAALKNYVVSFKSSGWKSKKQDSDLVAECRELVENFDKLTVELIVPKIVNDELESAKKLAKDVLPNKINIKKSNDFPSNTSDIDGGIYEQLDRLTLCEDFIPVTSRTISSQKPVVNAKIPSKLENNTKTKKGSQVSFGKQISSTSPSDITIRVDRHEGNMFNGFRSCQLNSERSKCSGVTSRGLRFEYYV